MSGLVQWTSRAKKKPSSKRNGAKPNAQRQQVLAARKRKQKLSATKAAAVAKRAAERAAE